MSFSFDTWMNISGISGVVLYLLAYWLLMRGFAERTNLLNRAMRAAGLALILIPLFLRWHLNGSLLMVVGVAMAGISGFYLLLKRRDRA